MQSEISGFIERIEKRNIEDLQSVISDIEAKILKICEYGTMTLRQSQHTRDMDQFLALQDSFAYNLAGRLALQLDWAVCSADHTDEAAVSAAAAMLRLIQGLCLIHRPSRLVFNNEDLMGKLIECTKHASPLIQTTSINALVGIMVRQVENIRQFESLKGLKAVCDTFKHRHTTKEVKLSILEFLFFYLIPETHIVDKDRTVPRKTTAQKQLMLGKYLSNVDGLVRELETSKPFGSLDLEW